MSELDKMAQLKEWVEEEITDVEIYIDPLTEEYEHMLGVRHGYKRVLAKIEEILKIAENEEALLNNFDESELGEQEEAL